MVAFLALRLPDSAALEYYKNLELGTKFLWYVFGYQWQCRFLSCLTYQLPGIVTRAGTK